MAAIATTAGVLVQTEKLVPTPETLDDDGIALNERADDSDPPRNWSYRYKMSIVVLISLMTTVDTLATVTCLPAVPKILDSFGSTYGSYSVLLVSIWEIGEGVGPFVIAPLSELLGRLPVYHVANVVFLLCSVAGALSISLPMLVLFRFLNGFAVASITLGPAMVGDMFVQDERGGAMAALYVGPLLGPVAGPVIGGFVTNSLGWRWTFWVIAIAVGVIQVPSFAFMRESYRIKTTNLQLNSSEEHDRCPRSTFARTMVRPFRMLLLSPVVLILSAYVAIVYGYLYLILTTLTEVLETTYHFQETESGLSYLGIGIGMVVGVVLCGATSDRYMKSKGNDAKPEHRLPPMLLGSLVLPMGLFLYGWTAYYHVHWILPLIGTGVIGFGLMTTVVPAETFLVDAYTRNSASAIAAMGFTRSMVGATFPLIGPPLYGRLGLGWGNSLLAFIAIALIPIPLSFLRYGHLLRQNFSFDG